jgi:molybdopterin-guanine dinucleotide biosynthesis protein B
MWYDRQKQKGAGKMNQPPCAVAVSGVKNSGKTGLIVRLLPELTGRGLRVATVKHDGHRFDADRPGTDSYRHLEAGAFGAAVFDGEKYQLVRRAAVDERFLISQFPEADLILLEGFKDSLFPKLEIVRAAVSAHPVSQPSSRLALVTDLKSVSPDCPVFPLDDVRGIADLLYRFSRIGRGFSAVLLAGGYSSRMGADKAELPFGGRRMIEHQVLRLQMLGIRDIMLAGYKGKAEGGRAVSDIVSHRGPLSGIHAGLSSAECTSCLVLSVDAPLVPFSVLFSLMDRHHSGITVIEHDGQIEPLIGIYDRTLAPLCAELLAGSHSSVRQLFNRTDFQVLPCAADPMLLSNCNTLEEYGEMLKKAER